MPRKYLYLISIAWVIASIGHAQDKRPSDISAIPAQPDYSLKTSWSALPFQNDAADFLPFDEAPITDSLKEVDLFYIYPTLYIRGKTWNASIENKRLNKRIDKYPVKYQASVFNQTARVYIPRYRQAIIHSFYDTTGRGEQALDLAYEDIKQAFSYYLEHYNQGRPMILASHSQGTRHLRQLLSDFFDHDSLRLKQLVCAYAVGFEIDKDKYSTLRPCEDPEETGCYVTWSSFKEGHKPGKWAMLVGNVCVNPISWRRDTLPSFSANDAILLSLRKRKTYPTQACIYQNYLWVKTKVPIVRHWVNLHLVDYNLFWYSIRRNAGQRVNAFLHAQ